MKNVTVGWFEIPVSDMERAISFYEAVFHTKLERHQMGPLDMAWFSKGDAADGAGGTLVYHQGSYTPSTEGVLVYFSSEDVSHELSRIEQAGDKILVSKKMIAPDVGYMALFIDSEGNRLALHSLK